MRILLDTNVLVRAVQRSHPACRMAADAVKTLHGEQHILCVAPQNVSEFWNVCTRPAVVNGLGLSVAATDRYASRLERMFLLLPDSMETFREWRRLVVQHNVIGAKVHDTRLVATMKVHGLDRILTFNMQDFIRYEGVTAIHPESVR
jgi:predicted nucleic acid-binding protein